MLVIGEPKVLILHHQVFRLLVIPLVAANRDEWDRELHGPHPAPYWAVPVYLVEWTSRGHGASDENGVIGTMD